MAMPEPLVMHALLSDTLRYAQHLYTQETQRRSQSASAAQRTTAAVAKQRKKKPTAEVLGLRRPDMRTLRFFGVRVAGDRMAKDSTPTPPASPSSPSQPVTKQPNLYHFWKR